MQGGIKRDPDLRVTWSLGADCETSYAYQVLLKFFSSVLVLIRSVP